MQQATAAADALLLAQLEHTFSPELDAFRAPDRAEHLEAMDSAASWEAWDRMRRTSGLPVHRAQRVLARLLLACCRADADAVLVQTAVDARPAS